MFAIVKLGNQQFKVKVGDFIRVPFQKASKGEQIEIPVLGFGDDSHFIFEKSQLKKSKVTAVLLRQSLAKKVLVFKKKRRKGYRRTKGYRQKVSELKIIELSSPEGKVSKSPLKKDKSTKSGTVQKQKPSKKENKKTLENNKKKLQTKSNKKTKKGE
ncbi:MAG: 50S ribosomal protein L21 [Bdellovibrionales bacterium]|nr:50S ribosomal protein L21 [Bdellovibrionales bacterium]